ATAGDDDTLPAGTANVGLGYTYGVPRVLSGSVVAAVFALGSRVRAQDVPPRAPLGFVGRPIPLDGPRPTAIPGSVRSFRAPVAVHLGTGVAPSLAATALTAAERACDGMERVLGLPLPLPDGTRGGSPDLDVYITPDGPTVDAVPEAMSETAPWDAASAYVRVRAVADPEALTRAVTEGVAQASV